MTLACYRDCNNACVRLLVSFVQVENFVGQVTPSESSGDFSVQIITVHWFVTEFLKSLH